MPSPDMTADRNSTMRNGVRRPPVRSPAGRHATVLGIGVIALSVTGAGIWAATAPLASAVAAQGQLVVAGKRKQVQHVDGGTVRALHVKDGDHVEPGAPVLSLDATEPAARLAIARSEYLSALAGKARMVAEIEDREQISFPPELTGPGAPTEAAALVASQSQVFDSRRSELAGQIALQTQRIEQLAAEIAGHQAELAATRVQIASVQQELATVKPLFDKGYATRTRLATLEREAARLDGARGRLEAEIAAGGESIRQTEMTRVQLKQQRRSEAGTKLSDIEGKLADLQARYVAAQAIIARLEVRSPVSGTVVDMQIHTVGGVIRPGEAILDIVPDGEPLVVEVKVRPADIESVAAGLATEVRITGLKSRTSPVLTGQVVQVSADALSEARTGELYYLARVEIRDSEIRRLGEVRLQPGMPAEALIKTGVRTAGGYLVQPILDSMGRALIER